MVTSAQSPRTAAPRGAGSLDPGALLDASRVAAAPQAPEVAKVEGSNDASAAAVRRVGAEPGRKPVTTAAAPSLAHRVAAFFGRHKPRPRR